MRLFWNVMVQVFGRSVHPMLLLDRPQSDRSLEGGMNGLWEEKSQLVDEPRRAPFDDGTGTLEVGKKLRGPEVNVCEVFYAQHDKFVLGSRRSVEAV